MHNVGKSEQVTDTACSECDRSFTRSDALAKHMRTVHETEALRPSDPVPKHHTHLSAAAGGTSAPASKLPRIKLKLSQHPKDSSHDTELQEGTIGTKETDLIAALRSRKRLGTLRPR